MIYACRFDPIERPVFTSNYARADAPRRAAALSSKPTRAVEAGVKRLPLASKLTASVINDPLAIIRCDYLRSSWTPIIDNYSAFFFVVVY